MFAAFIARRPLFKKGPCVRHPSVCRHRQFLADSDFGSFHFFPAHRTCWRLVVAQHSESFHRFGVIVYQLVDAILVAFALQTNHAVKSLVAEELRKVTVVNVNLGTLPKERHELAENFRILFHERGELFNQSINFICEHV